MVKIAGLAQRQKLCSNRQSLDQFPLEVTIGVFTNRSSSERFVKTTRKLNNKFSSLF